LRRSSQRAHPRNPSAHHASRCAGKALVACRPDPLVALGAQAR
jgi:hypothetical protein